MALLDEIHQVKTDPQAVAAGAVEVIGRVMKELDDGDPTRAALDRLIDGETPAQVMGLDREDLEALYALGFRQLTAGKVRDAQDVFLRLVQIDPLEARNHYCLALTMQMAGDLKNAASGYVQFLALDATNPDGWLRLGELHLAVGELDRARDCFESALAEAVKRPDGEAAAEQARGQIATIEKGAA